MSIQGNVNSLLSLASLIATQTPAIQEFSELHKINKKSGILGQQEEILRSGIKKEESLEKRRMTLAGKETPGIRLDKAKAGLEASEKTISGLEKTAEGIAGEQEALAKRRFDLRPTPQNYDAYQNALKNQKIGFRSLSGSDVGSAIEAIQKRIDGMTPSEATEYAQTRLSQQQDRLRSGKALSKDLDKPVENMSERFDGLDEGVKQKIIKQMEENHG